MSEEMLKNLMICAVGVLILAGMIVVTLLLVRSARKSRKAPKARPAARPESREVNAQPFSVEQEITYIHSQDRLDPQDQ